MRKRGFTALELLFVAVLIVGQLAVLLPLIESTREQQRANTCQNNIKQCATALQLYWNDYDGVLPSSVLASDDPQHVAPTQTQVVNFMTAIGNKQSGSASRPRTWPQILKDHMRDSDIVYCPSDAVGSRVSYWWKYAVDLAWRDSGIHARRESDYGYTADQVMFYEHAGWHAGDAAGIKDGIKINVAYMDTHVETITVANGPSSYPTPAQERAGASAIRLGEPMYYNFNTTTLNTCTGPAGYYDPREYSDKF